MKAQNQPAILISSIKRTIVLTSLLISATAAAQAHTNYGGSTRDFGSFQPGIIGSSVTKTSAATTDFGWADGTDPDFGDMHHIRAFRFTLQSPGTITITVNASTNNNAALGGLLPGFSLYSGLFHVTGGSDYDTSVVSQQYLASLGAPQPREGAFDALDTLQIGNDAGNLSTLIYIGNAADGTAANYGSETGINGDGFADGFVSASLTLAAGDYSLLIGGGNYAGTDATGSYGLSVNISTVPEPATFALIIAAGGVAWSLRRKKP